MRIEWHDTDIVGGQGQFVVHAENELERGVLRRFVKLSYSKDWKFTMHGMCYSCDLHGVKSFNFGHVKVLPDKKG